MQSPSNMAAMQLPSNSTSTQLLGNQLGPHVTLDGYVVFLKYFDIADLSHSSVNCWSTRVASTTWGSHFVLTYCIHSIKHTVYFEIFEKQE